MKGHVLHMTALLLLTAVLFTTFPCTGQCAPLSGWVPGTASFFGGPSDANSNAYKLTIDSGSCGYGDIDPRLYPNYNVVGLHKSNPLVQRRPMSACGSCLEIQCTSGTGICYTTNPVQMLVTDQCVDACNATNVNIHVFGFEQLAALRFGRMHIRYRLVECEPADPITIHIQDYRPSEGGWLRLALKNVAGDAALTAVDIGHAGVAGDSAGGATGSWMACRNTFGAVWEAGFNGEALPTPPLDLRVTNSLQQQVIVKNFVAFAGMIGDVETTAQFPSPFGADSAANASPTDASSVDAPPPPRPLSSPSVTVGIAIPRPTNAIAAPLPTLVTSPRGNATATTVPTPAPSGGSAGPPPLQDATVRVPSFTAPGSGSTTDGGSQGGAASFQQAAPPGHSPQLAPEAADSDGATQLALPPAASPHAVPAPAAAGNRNAPTHAAPQQHGQLPLVNSPAYTSTAPPQPPAGLASGGNTAQPTAHAQPAASPRPPHAAGNGQQRPASSNVSGLAAQQGVPPGHSGRRLRASRWLA